MNNEFIEEKVMTTVLFAIPLKKGKTDDFKAFVKECLGPKSEDYSDLLLRYNLNSFQMWIHTIADKDYVIFTHDMGNDAKKRLEGWLTSTHPFDQWFNQQLEDCYELDSMDNLPSQPEFIGELGAK